MTNTVFEPEPVKTRTGRVRRTARKALSAANSDTITFRDIATITAVLDLVAEDGTVGTFTVANGVVTVTNGGTRTWTCTVEGVRASS